MSKKINYFKNKFKCNFSFLNNKKILVTGGTGSFGSAFIKNVLQKSKPSRLVVFSRDEYKQFKLKKELESFSNYKILRFFLGDVRDLERLKTAIRDIDFIVHAAAIKQIDTAEYNPFECIKTNIIGAENIVRAALSAPNLLNVISLSTDKAVNPINLYGASKLAADKIFIAANQSARKNDTKFSIVRYGNVIASRGSIIPYFLDMGKNKKQIINLTDSKMTRFWISIEEAVNFVVSSLENMVGGEIFIPKIPSMNVNDILKSIAPNNPIKIIGKRPGEKVHETLLSEDESENSYESNDRFVTFPSFIDFKKIYRKKYMNFKKVVKEFSYTSLNNSDWIKKNQIKAIIEKII